MNIDDKRFVKFNQFLFLYNYKINYIDEAHKQSLPKLSVNIIYKNGGFDYQRYFAKNNTDLFEHIMQAIEADTKLPAPIKNIINDKWFFKSYKAAA